VNKLDTLFNDTLTRILTRERLAYMVLKRLLEDHEIKLSKRQLTQMSTDLVNSVLPVILRNASVIGFNFISGLYVNYNCFSTIHSK